MSSISLRDDQTDWRLRRKVLRGQRAIRSHAGSAEFVDSEPGHIVVAYDSSFAFYLSGSSPSVSDVTEAISSYRKGSGWSVKRT